jgi:hypothetical protein
VNIKYQVPGEVTLCVTITLSPIYISSLIHPFHTYSSKRIEHHVRRRTQRSRLVSAIRSKPRRLANGPVSRPGPSADPQSHADEPNSHQGPDEGCPDWPLSAREEEGRPYPAFQTNPEEGRRGEIGLSVKGTHADTDFSSLSRIPLANPLSLPGILI